MRRRRRPWSLLATVRLLFVALGVTLVLVTLTASIGRAAVRSSTDTLSRRDLPAQRASAALARAYIDQETGQRGFVLTGDVSFLQPYLAGRRAQAAARADLGRLLTDPVSRRELAAVDAAGERWRNLAAEPEILARSAGDVDPARQLALVRTGKRLFDELRTRLAAVDARVNASASGQLTDIARDQRIARWIIGPLTLFAVLVVVLAGLLLNLRLVRPTRALVDDVTAVAAGDHGRMVVTDGPREFGEIAEAVERMRVGVLDHGEQLAASRHRLARQGEQDRLSADLHDLIVQRVFAVGLRLESLAQRHPAVAAQTRELVDDTDEIIRELRAAIFDLRTRTDRDDLANDLAEVVEECSRTLPFTPTVDVSGSLEDVPLDTVGRELLATVRELLSNVARHAEASSARVTVHVADGALVLRVADDGVGMTDGHRTGDGTGNVAARAARLGGRVEVDSAPGAGTDVTWTVPLH